MDESTSRKPIPPPLGSIEPHAPLLDVPPDGQLLYKIMTVENLLRSITGEYLHFNRVDSYADFPNADPSDGQQLPKDRQGNAASRFEKAPEFSVGDYYDRSRARTYACCFSLENSDFIWNAYANGSEKGKVCVVFDYSKFRTAFNQSLQPGRATLEVYGNRCHQIFSVNYGIIQYVQWDRHQANAKYLPNPIEYTYLKAEKFSEEKELRVSLSAFGLGNFSLKDGSLMEFPTHLQAAFDFREAIADATIQQILGEPNCDASFLRSELEKLHIVASDSTTLGGSAIAEERLE